MSYIKRFYNSYLSKDKELARKIKSLVGFTPTRIHVFKLAFYHKSLKNLLVENDEKNYNNERLEYLGDAVLSTVVAEYLFKKYPTSNEGFLTKMRSKIVKRKSLNSIADKMGLDLFVSEYSHGKMSKTMLGNALEAVIGAVYLERGYRYTKHFIIKGLLMKYVDIHELENFDDNYKSQLLEKCQKEGKNVEFKLISKYKLDKRDRFKVGILVDGVQLSTGDDFNKKAAEQQASSTALRRLVKNQK